MAELLFADSTKLFPHFECAYGSDILPFLIDIFDITKNEPYSLIEYYKKEISDYYLNSAEKYNEIKDRFNQNHNPYDFLLLARTCYSGVIRFRKVDGYMSTPRGPHKPIPPEEFDKRVKAWNKLLQKANFKCESYVDAMDRAGKGDVVYCDPPYTHSQSIIYGAQDFDIEILWDKIRECKNVGQKLFFQLTE